MSKESKLRLMIKKFRKDLKKEYYKNDPNNISEEIRERDREIEDFDNFVQTLNEIISETDSRSKK